MRRRRSETISAQDYNEFLRLSQTPAPTAALKARARNSLPDSNLFSQAKPRQASHIPEIPSQFKNKIKDSSKIGTTCQDYWEGMDFDQDGTKTPTTNAGSFNSLHKTSMDKDMLGMEAEQLERDSKNIKRMNVMVVGAKGSGRHRLVSSLFREGNDDNDHGIRTAFDLIIKKGGRDGQDLFKFWVKDACCEGYMHLFKSYYQMADMFIFVYQVNDRSSFECLEKAIKQAKDEIKCKDFVGFLIAEKNENYECDRKVLYNEGEEVKEKYGLQGFFETSFEDNEEQNKFLNTLFPEDLKVEGE